MSVSDDLDWSETPEPMARQILTQAQTFVDAQLRAALALDQRAMTSASVFVGFSAAIIGLAARDATQIDGGSLILPALVAAAFFMLAAILAFSAARPVDFYYPGSHPRMWWPVRDKPLCEVLGGESENLQEGIDANEVTLRRNRKLLQWAMASAAAAPMASAFTWSLL